MQYTICPAPRLARHRRYLQQHRGHAPIHGRFVADHGCRTRNVVCRTHGQTPDLRPLRYRRHRIGLGQFQRLPSSLRRAEVSVYVRHDMRGAGVGKILLRHMLERAPSLGIRNVIALVFGHNYPSLNLFHRFGFEEWGRLPQVCDLETMLADVVILGKKIVD